MYFKTILVVFLVVFMASCHCPQTKSYPHQPSETPDRVTLCVQEDPSSSVGLTWRTQIGIDQPQVQYIVADSSPELSVTATITEGETIEWEHDMGEVANHKVTLTGLQAGTMYNYRVGNNNIWSEWFQFTTAKKNTDDFSFLYFGDAQNDIGSLWSRVIRQGFIDCSEAAFLLFAGDLINNASNDGEWEEWYNGGGWLYGTVPTLATPGNHEYHKDEEKDVYTHITPHWHGNFNFPANGPKDYPNTVYYIDYQGARFISLNTVEMHRGQEHIDAQVQWLEGVLANNPNKWTIFTFHHPFNNLKQGREDPIVRDNLQSLFEKYNVDLVLQGHDHAYGRDASVMNHISGNQEAGPVYIVSVSGPKMNPFNFSNWADRLATNTQMYNVIDVSNESIDFKACLTTGEVFDAFTISKTDEGQKTFSSPFHMQRESRMDLPSRTKLKMNDKEIEDYKQAIQKFFDNRE